MRLWPSALLKHRAFSAHHRLDRPWWRLDESGASCVRLYGNSGPVPYWYECWVRADGLYLVEAPKAVRSLQDEADSAEPIPHPGFRVGQIWARDPGWKWGEEHLDYGGYLIQQITAFRYDCAHECALWSVGGLTEATIRSEDLALRFKRAFLLADPCDPGKAPWSPTKDDSARKEAQ